MADKLYEGKGKTLEEAGSKLERYALSDGVTNLERRVRYEVSVVGKRGKTVTGKAHEDYALAFASALSAAKISPDKYDSVKNPFEVTARASYDVPASKTTAHAHTPSGSAPNSYTGKGLTDLF